ncbi:CsgG/HfaB family protein [Myroides sp. N17-2]|uniref:CsgG/HfaB family protein n=1 Tax=Myroides sp. N17-2 TaxID=2030799 RepID=UPI000EFB3754|nr:CsgG/HfaB family protein [Myroides sp. N17-2]
MKTTVTLLFLILTCIQTQAQNKISVAFIPITYDSETISTSNARIIQESILNSFVEAKKFTVVDRDKLAEIEVEKKLQRTESFMDSNDVITDGISKGASYLISPSILGVRHTNNKKDWETMLQVQIKVLDVSTGEILATSNINSEYINPEKAIQDARSKCLSKKEIKEFDARQDRLQKVQKHQEDAFIIALERFSDNVKAFTTKHFPLTLEITNWDAKNKNALTISAGSNVGLIPGQMIDIMNITEVTIGERNVQRTQKIATGCIIKVEDPYFADGIILNSEKSFKKLRDNNAPFKVITR